MRQLTHNVTTFLFIRLPFLFYDIPVHLIYAKIRNYQFAALTVLANRFAILAVTR